MIKFDNDTLCYEGKQTDLMIESIMIIENIFKELDPKKQYIFMERIMSTLVHAKEDKDE